jgi:pimeloyl-ACP methyl ester carboxylesterase
MDIKSIINTLSSGIFFPRKTSIPIEDKSKFRVLQFDISNEISIGGILYLNRDFLNVPTVIFFHGNGEVATDYSYFASKYLECGLNLAVFDFRGYGFSTGTPEYSTLFDDPPLIFEKFSGWLKSEYTGIISEVFFIFGRSLGSASASALAASNPENLRGVIFESSFGSIKRMMTLVAGRFPEINLELLNPFSNDTYLTQIKKPCLVIHGERDQIIPFSEGKYVFETIPESVEKEFIGIPYATHNDISSYEDQYFSPIKKFIEKYCQ